MKRLFYPGIIAFALLLSYLPGHAQDTLKTKGRWTATAKADKLSDKIDKELNLTKEQDKKIHAINNDISIRRDAIKHDTTLQKKVKQQKIKALDEERGHRFKAVLTPDQYKKWNDWEMKKKEKLEAKMDKKQEKKMAKHQ